MVISAELDAMRVLGDPLRQRIVALLAGESLCTCHLVEETGARQTNVSNHLRALRDANLVESEPCGRFTYYRLRPEALREVAGRLHELADTAEATVRQGLRRPCP
jgi:DNA-binding transcriptional ArsR family regulator